MKKQNQTSGNNSTNTQIGRDQYTALHGSSIYVKEEDIIAKIYNDLAHPSLTQLGKAMGTLTSLFNTILHPIELINLKRNKILSRNLYKLNEELSQYEREDIVSIPHEIGVPLLEKLFYVTDEELSSLYVKLLKRASIKQECNLTHPSFVNCVTNLSPDEAKLILHLKGNPLEFINPYLIKHEKGGLPLQKHSTLYLSYYKDEIKSFIFPDNIQIYFENLMRLGILETSLISNDMFSDTSETIIKKFTPVIKSHSNEIDKFFKKEKELGYKEKFKYIECEFSDYGKLFLNAVEV